MRAGWLAGLLLVAACSSSAEPPATTTINPQAMADEWIAGRERNFPEQPAVTDQQRHCLVDLFAGFTDEQRRLYASGKDMGDFVNDLEAGLDACL